MMEILLGTLEPEVCSFTNLASNAGSDTTANTAMFTTYELARYPAVQARLHQELCDAFPDPNKPLSFATLEKLQFLDGVCREGLRLHAPIPCYLERVAPTPGLDICGYPIPAGTVIGMQGYTNHRDSVVYSAPDTFAPERWFEATAAMRLNFLPFSSGSRACIGLK
jgi:cytochrome P450